MNESGSDRPLQVSAEHRKELALRTLARALISFARQSGGSPPPVTDDCPHGAQAEAGR